MSGSVAVQVVASMNAVRQCYVLVIGVRAILPRKQVWLLQHCPCHTPSHPPAMSYHAIPVVEGDEQCCYRRGSPDRHPGRQRLAAVHAGEDGATGTASRIYEHESSE